MNRKTLVLAAVLGLATMFSNSVLAQEGPGSVNNILNSSLGSIDETYRGQHAFFSDDWIGNLLSQVGVALQDSVVMPFWRGLMQGDPGCFVVATALCLVAAGFLLRMGARLFDALA
jgi:hypothetical protein